MSTDGKLHPNRWLKCLNSMVEPDNKSKWTAALVLYVTVVVLAGFNSSPMSALMVAYLMPMILAVLIVACTTLDYLVDRVMSAK